MKNLVLILAVILTGCATHKPPVKKEIENMRTFKQSYDQVWSKLIQKISADGMAVRLTDKDSGLITFDHIPDVNFYAMYFDCGTMNKMFAFDFKPINLNVSVVKGVEPTVRINLSGSWMLRSAYGHVVKEGQCYSTGKFEQELFDSIGGVK